MTVIIRNAEFRIVAQSRNLRGIIDYSRSHAIERIDLYKGPQLGISWVDGASCITDFADVTVMHKWIERFKGVPIHDHTKETACNR